MSRYRKSTDTSNGKRSLMTPYQLKKALAYQARRKAKEAAARALRPPKPTHEELLHQRIRRGDPGACWPYTGHRDIYGYGKHPWKKPDGTPTQVPAQRLVWTLANGPIPPGLVVMHSCDNPPCCNPAHLSLGTHADNARDRDAKGRGKASHRLMNPIAAKVIRLLDSRGVSRAKLAEAHGVTHEAIKRICARRTYSNVT